MRRKVIAAVGAGGLGLPDRDYYMKTDAKSVETRERYVAHVAKMFELLGDPPAAAKRERGHGDAHRDGAREGLAHEVERRDPYKTYHRNTLGSLPKIAPASTGARTSRPWSLNPNPWLNVDRAGVLQGAERAARRRRA